ncbi:MAG: GNAT family N-acetyltransferase [Porticoccaceae bacterium]|nr:GNAT family N-acetyltransferase [Porticoccaceae bacterium]
MTVDLNIRTMTAAEVPTLIDWANTEGWNPGLHDATSFLATDANAFLAAERSGKLIGGGATTSYAGEFGFMGFFIVRPEFRGQGFGDALWQFRRQHLLNRLLPDASIGMDGVFAMQDYYAKGGFVFSHRNLRFCKTIPQAETREVPVDTSIIPLVSTSFSKLIAYDRSCFPAPRPEFLRSWINQPDSLGLAYQEAGELKGYGVIRRCAQGYKIGPLFADSHAIADSLYRQLTVFAAGDTVYLDAPENNPAAMALVTQHKMQEVFGCARMYLGDAPNIIHERIYGVTTFELG